MFMMLTLCPPFLAPILTPRMRHRTFLRSSTISYFLRGYTKSRKGALYFCFLVYVVKVELRVVDFGAPLVLYLESADTSAHIRIEEALPNSAANQTEALGGSQVGIVILQVGRRRNSGLEHEAFQIHH